VGSVNKYFLEDENGLDVLFLDIEFPGEKDGIYIGNVIKNEFYAETHLVYISSHPEYALELFKNHPYDFVEKSPDHRVFYKKVEKVVNDILHINTEQKKSFAYKVGKNEYEIALYKILYFVHDGRQIKIVTFKKNLENDTFYGKISEIGEQLANSDFFVVHQSFLVNYHGVAKFEYEKLEMINGDEVPIAQAYRKKVREMRMKKMEEK